MGVGETLRHSLENAKGRERMGYVLGFEEIDRDAGRGRWRQGREPGGAFAD